MSGTLVLGAAILLVGIVLVPGLLLVWPSRRDPNRRADLGVALLTGALVAFTVLALQLFFELRFSELENEREAERARLELGRQAERERSDRELSMRLAISSQKELSGMKLVGEDLSGFYFGGKDLTWAQMQEIKLVGAVLDEVDLANADLSRGDLTGAYLRGATLRRAILVGATLNGAQATATDFTDADLRGASLLDADLSDAKLQGANLVRARITADVLGGIEYNAQTKWPAHLRLPKCPDGLVCCADSGRAVECPEPA